MDLSQGLAATTAVVVVVVSVASGPLVGAVDLTAEPTAPAPPGVGSADVEVLSVPETIALERAAFGGGTFHLDGPPARLSVGAVSGNPVIEYVVRIPGVGLIDIHEYHVHETPDRTIGMTFRPMELSPNRVTGEEYEGTIEIRLQSDEPAVLYEGPVTVEVRR